MISSAATPATGEPRNGPGRVAAGLEAGHPDVVEALPDLRDVLDLDPVVLDVLAVGDVGGAAGEVGADAAEGAQLGGVEQGAVAADAQHEELVVELLLLEHRGLAAVEARSALGVEAHPPEPAAQVGRVDRGEAALGVDVQDPGADVERVVVLLGLLVLVQRLGVAERPLSLATLGAGASGAAESALGAGRGSSGVTVVISQCPGVRGAGGRRTDCVVCDGAAARRRWIREGSEPAMTHHAAGTTEVHVAAGHEPGGRISSDHGTSLRFRTPVPQTRISCRETACPLFGYVGRGSDAAPEAVP